MNIERYMGRCIGCIRRIHLGGELCTRFFRGESGCLLSGIILAELIELFYFFRPYFLHSFSNKNFYIFQFDIFSRSDIIEYDKYRHSVTLWNF